MKKLLLCGAAAGVVFAASPALAQIDVTVGGHTKNYMGWLNQDDSSAVGEARNFDILQESELHVNAEGTADNGLTYGFHMEMDVDRGDGGTTTEESYLYLSSDMGRINLGEEDGANFLLQVAAPSADSNIDGIKQYINPVAYAAISNTAAFNTYLGAFNTAGGLDYDNDLTGKNQKITYLSPIWNGFQFGVSYTPEVGDADATGLSGFNTDGIDNDLEDAWEAAFRYEGNFNNVGFALGAGYTTVDTTELTTPAVLDDFEEWNVGLDLDIGAFGIGAIYTDNNNGTQVGDSDDTIVVGVDYTTGPFKLGASYLTKNDEAGLATGEYETDRYTGGVIYTAAPGLSFRGSVSFVDHSAPTAVTTTDVSATSVMGGVQLNF